MADQTPSFGSPGLRLSRGGPPDGPTFERLRESLLDLCYERGYPALSLGDLLAHAGVAEADFLRHFRNLDEFFASLYRAEYEACQAEAERAREDAESWQERLRVTGYVLYRFLAKDPRLARFIVLEVAQGPPAARLVLEEGIAAMSEILAEGGNEASVAVPIAESSAQSIGGGIFLHLYNAVGEGEMPPEDEAVPEMMYAAVLPYLGPERAAEELRAPPPPPPRPPSERRG